jgi:hypothetical protein
MPDLLGKRIEQSSVGINNVLPGARKELQIIDGQFDMCDLLGEKKSQRTSRPINVLKVTRREPYLLPIQGPTLRSELAGFPLANDPLPGVFGQASGGTRDAIGRR